MQIPILSGIYTDQASDYRVRYPTNLVPVVVDSGISKGYLRPADGILPFTLGPGLDRGGINWDGICYRVMGRQLVRVNEDKTITLLGDVGLNSTQVTLDYSFDRLAIASDDKLFYYSTKPVQCGVGTEEGLVQVTDPDLGRVVDMIWIDGYFMTTDGEFVVVTDLADPCSVQTGNYASSESDPDPVVALKKLRNEAHVVNRYTIEVLNNIGGTGFPFQRVSGAQMQKGAVGTKAVCVFGEALAFVGGGRNETVAVYIGVNSNTQKISTHEIDLILATYTEQQLSTVIVEERLFRNNLSLYVHLPDRTIVYDAGASQLSGIPIWYNLSSSVTGEPRAYRAKNFVYCYNRWLAGDTETLRVVELSESVSTHLGEFVRWEFQTPIVYNESRGAIFHQLELVGLTGRTDVGVDPVIGTSYSLDGVTFSQVKYIQAGKFGETQKRLVWFSNGFMRNFRVQKFQGDSQSHLSFSRLEANLEPLVH